MVKLKIFNDEETPQSFIDDFRIVVSLPEEKIKNILYILVDLDYIIQYKAKAKELSKELDMDEDDILSAFDVSVFLLQKFFSEVSKEDLKKDLKQIADKPEEITKLKNVLKQIDTPEFKEKFETVVDSTIETRKGLPALDGISYTINKRAVIRNGELVREIPIVILRLGTDFNNKKEYITIQQTKEELQNLIDVLKEALDNVKKLK